MPTCSKCGHPLTASGECHCHYVIPLRARVKPRPRVTKGHTYMPKGYVEWRSKFKMYLCCDTMPAFAGLLGMSLVFRFAKRGRGDADNLAGGVMDACQGSLYDDDANIIELDVKIERNTGKDEIEVSIWEL